MKYFVLYYFAISTLSFASLCMNGQSWDLCVNETSCSNFTFQTCTEDITFTIENISEDFTGDGLWTYMYFDLYESDIYLNTYTITEGIPQAIGSIASFTASNISSGVYYVIVRVATDQISPTERGYSENINLVGTPPNSTSNYGLLTNFRNLDQNSYRGYINNSQLPGVGNTNVYNCEPNEGIADLISADIMGDSGEELILATNGTYGCLIRYKQSLNSQWTNLYGPIANKSITCLDAGQLDLDIKDELVFGLLNNNTTEGSAYYYPSISSSPISFYGPNSFQTVTTIATGDLDNNGKDEIYVGFNSDNNEASVWKKVDINSGWEAIYSANSIWHIETLYIGDPDDNGVNQLYWGFNKNSTGGAVIYFNDGTSGNFVTVYLYNNKWNVKDITGGRVYPAASEDVYFSFVGNNQFERGTITKSSTGNSIGTNIFCPYSGYSISDIWLSQDNSTQSAGGKSLQSYNDLNPIQVFPNPSLGLFTINSISEQDIIKIYNLQGQVIHEICVENGKASVNLENLDSGIYLLRSVKTNFTEQLYIH